MSDRKLPHFLRHCRCVHHCWRQKATTCGKLPATKGVILRQVRCRLLSLFVAPVLPRFFHNDFVRGWCLSKKYFHDGLFQRRFMVGVNVGNCRRSWLRIPVGISRGIVVDCPWLGAWLWTVRGLSTANAARRLARMLATRLAPREATRLAIGCQRAKQHPKHFARHHARHKNLIWLRGNACPMKIHGMGCVRESKIRLYVAGRRVNVLLASSGCAPHCTRRRLRGFCLYDFAHERIFTPVQLFGFNENFAHHT